MATPTTHGTKSSLMTNAPSKNLPFPISANLTAIELLTFFPYALKSVDVVYRLVSNGATRQTLWAIVNTVRDLEGQWHANSCGMFMYKAMRHAGFENWTVSIHDRWHATRKDNWDEANLNVGGFRTPHNLGEPGTIVKDISFMELAVNVRKMPEGDDALDLTRIVEYCLQKPEKNWRYPQHYEELLELLGGPQEVTLGHTDGEAFKRWNNVVPPPPRPKLRCNTPIPDPKKRKESEERTGLKMPNKQPKSQGRSRKSTHFDNDEVDAASAPYAFDQSDKAANEKKSGVC